MRKYFAIAALLVLAGPVLAEITADALVEAYLAEGYDRIEVQTGPTQISVEAIRGATKVEVVYDIATGTILERDTEAVEADDVTTPGVVMTNAEVDFLDAEDGGEKADRPRRGRDDAEDFGKDGGDEDDDDDDDPAEDAADDPAGA